MQSLRCVLVLLGLGLVLPKVEAQGLLIQGPAGFGGSFSYSHHRPHFGLSVGGYGLGVPTASYGVSRVTVIYGYTPPPTLVIVPRRLLDEDDPPAERPSRQRVQPEPVRPEPTEPEEAPLPGQPAGRFRPVEPEDRLRAKRQAASEPRPEAPRPPEQKPPPPPVPRVQPWTHLDQGKAAFTTQAYGRAAQHFRQATLASPDRPDAYFLLAQALVTLGKYREAVEAIHSGLHLEPGWPSVQYRPSELYGPNIADYSDQLRALGEAVAQHPEDADLLFLTGYQLWFDGRRDEARAFLQRASKFPSRKADSERFLQALPGTPIF